MPMRFHSELNQIFAKYVSFLQKPYERYGGAVRWPVIGVLYRSLMKALAVCNLVTGHQGMGRIWN